MHHAPTPDHPGQERYPCFDGLRAIAALTVVGVHTAFASGFTTKRPQFGRYTSRLEIGVEVFFVVSGYLLYRPFAAALAEGKEAPDRRRFWIRRLKRIVPAFWVAFLLSVFVLHTESTNGGWYAPIVDMAFGQIYVPHLATKGLSQAWSLDTEMTFYLMVPFYAAAIAAMARRWPSPPAARLRAAGVFEPGAVLRVQLAGLAALTALSFAWRIPVLAVGGLRPKGELSVMTSWLPAYVDQFALGMLLAVLSVHFRATGKEPPFLAGRMFPWVSWGLAAGAFVAVSNIGLPLRPLVNSPVGTSLARQALYGAFALFLVAPAVFGPQHRGPVRQLLRWRPLALVGVVSYGVYLWHEAWMAEFLHWTPRNLFDIPWPDMFLGVSALALVTATLSYRLVERPIIRSALGARRAVPARAAAPTGLVALGERAPA